MKAKAKDSGLNASVFHGTLADYTNTHSEEKFDHVVCTLVLCSVPELAPSLKEVRELLKPQGNFVFVEHVADKAGGIRPLMQKMLEPIFNSAAGCHCTRHTGDAVRVAGFASVDLDYFVMEQGPWPLRPHVRGIATNP